MNEKDNFERFVSDGNYNLTHNGKTGADAIAELNRIRKEKLMNAYNKYIPLGSVVSLNDARKLMVIGYKCADGQKRYDYVGCIFPYGWDQNHPLVFFNHDMIQKFFSIGFVNDHGNSYRSQLAEAD